MSRSSSSTRRRFFLGAGAALSAPIALAMPLRSAAVNPALEARVAALEDANAIRELLHAYMKHVSSRVSAAAERPFAERGAASLDAAVSALAADPSGHEARIEIAADRTTAVARLPCTVRIESSIEAPACTLLDMARAQGEGVLRRSEVRVLEQRYVRHRGVWKIAASALRESSAAVSV